MAAIQGQPAPKPGGLGKPVPGKTERENVDAFLASFDAPAVQAPPQESPQTQADSFANQIGQVGQGTPVPDTTPNVGADQFAPEPSFAQANVDQFQNFTTRLQAGLASNDNEKLGFLRKKFGQENATIRNGDLYFRRASNEKFKRLDPATLEVINDLIPDFARELVTEGTMLPAEMAGAAVGGPAGLVASRVAAVPIANAAADSIAALAGVPQDESRNIRQENLVGQAAETFLPVVGGAAAKQVLKRFPGTEAYKAAKAAGEREIVALSKQSQEVAAAVDALAQQGRAAQISGELVGIPEANVSLMGHQLNPDNPVLQNFVNSSASDPRFINAQRQLAEDWGSSLENTLMEIGRRGNKGPVLPEKLAESVTSAVSDLQRSEGQAIGQFRTRALAKLGNKKEPLPGEVIQKVSSLLPELGFEQKALESGKVTYKAPKDLRPLVGKFGITSIGEARALVNNVQDLANGLGSGVSLTELDRLRNAVGSASDSLYRTPAGAALGAISGDLRKAYRMRIESGLVDDFDKRAFGSTMDDFAQLKLNVGTLKNALNEDSSAKAIVSSIFTGKENLGKVKAIKQLSPESFGALKEEWVNQLMTEYGSRQSPTRFKSGAFLDAINKKYGKQFVSEVLDSGGPGPDSDTVRKILSVTERIENTYKNVAVDSMSETQKKALADAGIGLLADIKFKKVNGIKELLTSFAGGGESKLLALMTRDGIDKYVSSYPGKIDKAAVRQNLADILAEYKLFGAIAKQGGRMTQATVKNQMQSGAGQ